MTEPTMVGTVAVEVSASAKGFAQRLRKAVVAAFRDADLGRELSDAVGKTTVKISPQVDDKQLPKEIPTRRPPKVPVELDPLTKAFLTKVKRDVSRLGRQVEARVPVGPDTDELRSRLRAALAEVSRRVTMTVPTEPGERAEFEAQLRAMLAQVSRQVEVAVPVEVDRKATVTRLKADLAAVSRRLPAVTVPLQVARRTVTRVSSQIAAMFRQGLVAALGASAIGAVGAVASAGLAGLAAAAAGLVPVLVTLGATAVTASGSLLAIPGAVAIVQAAIGTVRLGLSGLDEALKAVADGNAEKLAEALKRLSPNARRFVLEVRKLRPAFERLRLDVQNALFRDTAQTLRALARSALPVARRGMTDLARTINRAVVGALRQLNTSANRVTLGAIFTSATSVVAGFGAALGPVTQALLDVLQVSTQVLATLTPGISGAVADVAERVSEMAANGELRQMFLDGLAAAGQFLRLGQDILGILGGIGRAAGGDGGGVFAFFDRLNEMINSVAGQQALGQVFDELGRIGEALTPVLLALLKALGPIAQAIGDVAVAVSPALVSVADALAVALTSLAPAMVALAPALVAVADAVTPLAIVFAQLVTAFTPGLVALVEGIGSALMGLATAATTAGEGFGSAFGPGSTISTVSSLAQQVGAALGQVAAALGPVLGQLAVIVAELLVGLAPGVTAALQGFGQALQALAPVAPLVANALSDLLVAVAPLLPVIGQGLAVVLQAAALALANLSRVLGPVIAQIAGGLGEAITALAPVMAQWASQVMPIAARAGIALARALEPLIPVLVEIARMIAERLAAHIPQFAAMFERMVPVVERIAAAFTDNLLSALESIAPMLPDLIDSFIELSFAWAQIMATLTPIIALIAEFAAKMFEGEDASDKLETAVTLVTGAMRVVTGWLIIVRGALQLAVAIIRAAKDAWNALKDAVERAIGETIKAVKGLPGKIKDGLGDLGGLLYGAGKAVIQGLIDGIKYMFKPLGDVASRAAQVIKDRFPSSPAKVGPLSGRGNPYYSGISIADLLASGMDHHLPVVAAAAGRLAAAVEIPFNTGGGLIPAPAGFGNQVFEAHLHHTQATLEQLEALQQRQAIRARLGRAR